MSAQRRHRRLTRRLLTVAAVIAAAVTGVVAPASAYPSGPWEWTMSGYDIGNSHWNPYERTIGVANAGNLTVKWTATTAGDVSATPAVTGGAVYFPDWGGYLWKLDAATGRTIWSHKVADYVGIPGVISRSSPAILGDTLYIGIVNSGDFTLGPPTASGGYLLAIDTKTGDLRWKTLVDDNITASITGSPVVFGGVVYMGVSSVELRSVIFPGYKCCSFRGSLVAVSAATGQLLWKTYTIPENGSDTAGRYTGGSIWGGPPAIDPSTNTIYATTGNNYSMPNSAYDCERAGGSPRQCMPDWNIYDAMVAFDLKTGELKWDVKPDWYDLWNGQCINPANPGPDCPFPGPSHDFADGAHVFTFQGPDGVPIRWIGAGQKSGQYWMLDAATGNVVWKTWVGPADHWGGIQWGTANDGQRIYFQESDHGRTPYTLPDGRTIDYSSFGALDPATGRILWQVPDPHGGIGQSAVTTANGVMYVCSLSGGHMYALDGSNGNVLWDYVGQGSCNAAPAVVGGTVYWGNGYQNLRLGTPGNKLYAFSVPGS